MRRFAFLVWITLAACSSTSSSGSTGSPQRSATCLAFQDALCDHFADTCGASSRAECDDTVRSLFCKDDASAGACVEALSKATCDTTPAVCGSVLDPAPAVSLCKEVGRRYCAARVRCKEIAADECQRQVDAVLSCAQAIGAAPKIDLCFRALDAATCPVSVLPDPCKGVIKLRTDDSALSRADPWGVAVPL